jgi:hypothetical protein
MDHVLESVLLGIPGERHDSHKNGGMERGIVINCIGICTFHGSVPLVHTENTKGFELTTWSSGKQYYEEAIMAIGYLLGG